MHGPGPGVRTRREQIPSHIELVHGPCAGVVGDGLVPSRAKFVHGPRAGDDKRRPYESLAESAANGFVPYQAGRIGDFTQDGLLPSAVP